MDLKSIHGPVDSDPSLFEVRIKFGEKVNFLAGTTLKHKQTNLRFVTGWWSYLASGIFFAGQAMGPTQKILL